MDFLLGLLPYLGAGLAASIAAKATGINMSMCMLLVVLYMGATPTEAVIVMLTFNTYSYFTVYSQLHRISFKDFTFFPGVRIAIPLVLTIAAIAIQPFLGITLFVGVFLLEMFALIYKGMDPEIRPDIKSLIQMCAIASVLTTIGVALIQFFPAQWYFVFAGLVIIGYVVLMWSSGNRSDYQNIWDKILYGAAFLTGLTGIEAADWLESQHRSTRSGLSRCFVIVINTAMVVALLISYAIYNYFSIGALFTTVGAAVGVRLFGIHEFTGKGKFNYVTMGLAVLAVLIFYLVQPVPVGFPEIEIAADAGFHF